MKEKIFMIIALIILQACGTSSNLINDIKQSREKNKAAKFDISSILKKHIKKGSSWYEVSEQLTKDGFKCTVLPSQQAGSNIFYHCVLDLRKWYDLGFGDKIRINISVENDKVIAFGGEVIYLSL